VMALVEQLCSHVAVISGGRVLAAGRLDDVRGERRLEAVFVDLVGAEVRGLEGLSWLRS
jgi:ABC-2 type transport system ATP-binding protein